MCVCVCSCTCTDMCVCVCALVLAAVIGKSADLSLFTVKPTCAWSPLGGAQPTPLAARFMPSPPPAADTSLSPTDFCTICSCCWWWWWWRWSCCCCDDIAAVAGNVGCGDGAHGSWAPAGRASCCGCCCCCCSRGEAEGWSMDNGGAWFAHPGGSMSRGAHSRGGGACTTTCAVGLKAVPAQGRCGAAAVRGTHGVLCKNAKAGATSAVQQLEGAADLGAAVGKAHCGSTLLWNVWCFVARAGLPWAGTACKIWTHHPAVAQVHLHMLAGWHVNVVVCATLQAGGKAISKTGPALGAGLWPTTRGTS